MSFELYPAVLTALLLTVLVGAALTAKRCWPRQGATDRSLDRFALALAIALMSFRSFVLVLNGVYLPEHHNALRLTSTAALAIAAVLVWVRGWGQGRRQ